MSGSWAATAQSTVPRGGELVFALTSLPTATLRCSLLIGDQVQLRSYHVERKRPFPMQSAEQHWPAHRSSESSTRLPTVSTRVNSQPSAFPSRYHALNMSWTRPAKCRYITIGGPPPSSPAVTAVHPSLFQEERLFHLTTLTRPHKDKVGI